jgi:hypothetical protein
VRNRRFIRTTIPDNFRSRRCAIRTASGYGWRSSCRVIRSGCEHGRCRLAELSYTCLDSNDPANSPLHRGITSELYGGGPELRLKQEMVLGIGGWRLLSALGIEPEVCHLNEGHAAFAVLERARHLWKKQASPLKQHWPCHESRQPVHHTHGCGRRL